MLCVSTGLIQIFPPVNHMMQWKMRISLESHISQSIVFLLHKRAFCFLKIKSFCFSSKHVYSRCVVVSLLLFICINVNLIIYLILYHLPVTMLARGFLELYSKKVTFPITIVYCHMSIACKMESDFKQFTACHGR